MMTVAERLTLIQQTASDVETEIERTLNLAIDTGDVRPLVHLPYLIRQLATEEYERGQRDASLKLGMELHDG
jgi:hypothetical protein